MRLSGIINGSLTFADRPTFFGEIFDLGATVETPGVSDWINLPTSSAAAFANISAAVLDDWQNISVSAAPNWANG